MKKILLSVFVAVALLTVTVSALAQVDVSTATLRGTVTDPDGAVIAGATVTVKNPGRGLSRVVKSGSDGTYQLPLLQPGIYEVEIEAAGFSKEVIANVELNVGQSVIYDIRLRLGAVTSVVDVIADAPLIQVEQTQQANTINQAQVENLPNIGRNFAQSVFTLPGVSSSDATRSQQPGFTGFGTTGFSIGGSNGRNNLSTIDGGENEYGTGQYRVLPSIDSIQEFQVNRNAFAAEFGFTVGSTVNVVTKSGGNQFHGSGYIYFRDEHTEASNFFNRFLPSPGGTGGYQKAFSQNLYPGGTLGGPLIKNKLFFFTSYEFTKLDQAGFNFLLNSAGALGINGTSITGLAQQSYFNQLASSGNPFLAGFAAALKPALVPQNNANLLKMLTRNDGAFNTATRAHTWLTRVDYQPNSNNSLTFRFELQRSLAGAQSFPDGSGLTTRDYSILTNWARTLSASVVNQVRVQVVPFNRADQVPNGDNGTFLSISELNGAGYGGAGTGFGFGHSNLLPYLAHQRRFQFEDNLSWTRGRHNFKFGVSYRPADYNVEDDLYRGGQFDFASGLIPLIALAPGAVQAQLVPFNLAHGFPATGPPVTNLSGPEAFVLGIPDFYHGGFGNFAWHGWAHYFGSFAQDSWKISPRFTVDFGGRFDLDAEPSPLGHHSYFSPRLGFAWDPWGDHKTVIRAGAGIFEGPIDVLIPSYGALLNASGQYINQVLSILASPFSAVQPTTIYGFGLASGKLPFGHLTAADLNLLGVATGPGNPNRVVFSIDPNYRNPYSVQASLSIQRELAHNISLEVGYNMYHGVHLQMPHDTSVKATGVVDPFIGPLYAPIDPTVFQQTTYSSIGSSIYHGLTASLTKRFSNHLQFQANYTFSKTLDNTIDFASFQNWFRPDRLNQFRAISVFDFPHVFVANAVYATPFKASEGNFLSRAFADVTIAPILTMRRAFHSPSRFRACATGRILTTSSPRRTRQGATRGEDIRIIIWTCACRRPCMFSRSES